MAFDEVRFPTDISHGALGGPMFATKVIVVDSGAEQRIGKWSQGRRRWDVAHALKNPTQAAALLDFFLCRQGKLRGFRFKDWLDYTTDQPVAGTRHDCVSLTSTTFQLAKRYTSGAITHVRHIKKPAGDTLTNTAATQANSTVRIYNGVTEITSGWTVNLTTGVVTFSGAPGYTPSARFEFDFPARFDTDEMRMALEDTNVRTWDGIPLVELLL